MKIKLDTNLLDYSDWVGPITGSTNNFNNQGSGILFSSSKNYLQINSDPFGSNVYVWNSTIVSGATAHSSGGWITDRISIDTTKNYRYSVWVKRKNNSVSRFYLGCAAYNAANTNYTNLRFSTTGAVDSSYGGPSYNINFTSSTWFADEQWYLVTMAILNSGSTSGSTLSTSGVWNSGGTKTVSFNDVITTSGTSFLDLRYLAPYVTTTGATHYQAVYPRIDLLDGTEPSIQTLLDNEGPWRDVTNVKINIGDTWREVTDTKINIGDSWKTIT